MITVGADPELFLVNKKAQFVSAIGKFGGTKRHPKPLGKIKGMMVQEDNVAVEFNIPPARTSFDFQTSIQTALDLLAKKATKMHLSLAIVPSAEFPLKELRHNKARDFGCDPDFNVWSLEFNPRPFNANKQLRSAGGHVHIGVDKCDPILLGRACDLFLGCPSIMFDSDLSRRLLYGKSGAIRQKSYGIEYRTLSNFWIKSHQLMKLVFEQVEQAIAFTQQGKTISDLDSKVIQHCINQSDMNSLRILTKKFNLVY